MSGGLDSSVAAALLLEEGYDVRGVMMRFPVYTTGRGNSCCSQEAEESAYQVSKKLGISLEISDCVENFNEKVVGYFCQEYSKGRTPNPCAVCNRSLKFDFLLKKAADMGVDFLATGHYARIEQDKFGVCFLKNGIDKWKDQSYFLFLLKSHQLSKIKFPLGNYRKEEIKKMAGELGLEVHDRPESQEICFVKDDYREFLKEMVDMGKFTINKDIFKPGDIVTKSGKKVGRHQGIASYTVGQRRGLGAYNRPVYVIRIDAVENRVVIGSDEDLYLKNLSVNNLNWLDRKSLESPEEFKVKIRYRHKAAPALVSPKGPDGVELVFRDAQRAITPGQAAVFYKGDILSGGGWID
ncbi:MAG: tRNA 2-thiouridine(34) synthase MnmA [Elusimicrobia bacterium]|nr:tRNA 2-thiouridine(34) synthase MnmA [Elusimicrobiota bacterium]